MRVVQLGPIAAVGAVALALSGVVATTTAGAVAPPGPPGCGAPIVTSHESTTPVPIPTGPVVVTSTIDVTGAGTHLTDVDLFTDITHTFSADVDITLQSPAGTISTITTDNGAGNDNTFAGTTFDDQADPDGQVPYVNNDGLVTDHLYANNTVATPLVPEEAMAAFAGEDPNGTWTLTISDDLNGDAGTLNSWRLDIQSLPAAPAMTATQHASTAPVGIPTGPAVVTSTIDVTGTGTHLSDLNLFTDITHTFNADLDITLQSPAGTISTITTDNGAGNDNVFAGTTFDDQADPDGQVPYVSNPGLVTDHPYADNTVATPLVPEEAMAAFAGEDPNGTWTLTISDDLNGDAGSLNSWRLDVTTGTCEAPEEPACDADLDPAGCWRFGEASGTTAFDSSPNGNDGTYAGGPVLGVPGAVPGDTAASFDGRDDRVSVPDAPSLDVGDSFSLEGWIKRDVDTQTMQLFNKGAKGFHLVVMSKYDGNQVWLRKAGSSTIVRTAGGVPADGSYHHVVATKDAGAVAIHIDGVAQPLEAVSLAQVIQDTAAPLFFSATSSGNPVAGDLDEFAVYGRALTASEVGDRFARGGPSGAGYASARSAAKKAGTRRARSGRGARGARRPVARRQIAASAAGGATTCQSVGTPGSGVTGITATGVKCAGARALLEKGLQRLQTAGFTCEVTAESFDGPVRITRECRGPGAFRLRFTTVS